MYDLLYTKKITAIISNGNMKTKILPLPNLRAKRKKVNLVLIRYLKSCISIWFHFQNLNAKRQRPKTQEKALKV